MNFSQEEDMKTQTSITLARVFFEKPKQSIGNNSGRFILFKQAPRDIESIYRDVGAYDMNYGEFEKMCRKAWSEKINHLYIDKTRDENEGNYRFFNENKNTYSECIPESEAF